MGSTQSQGRNQGHISDKFNPLDKSYYYAGPPIDQTKFNGERNLWDKKEDYLKPVYDQTPTNSCVANATAAAVRFLIHTLINIPGHDKSLDDVEDPSRLFIYYLARAYDAMDEDGVYTKWPIGLTDGGCCIRNAFKATHAYGITAETKWPWHEEGGVVVGINDRPVDSAFDGTALVKGIEFCRLDPDHTEAAEELMGPDEKAAIGNITLFRLRQCIYEGYPVVFGFKFYWEDLPVMHTKLGEDFPNLGLPPTWPWEKRWGSHGVLAVAYDHSNRRVLIQNSWGEDSNTVGHFWMPYEWIQSFEATEDFWMVRVKKPLSSDSPSEIKKVSDLGLTSSWRTLAVPSDYRQMSPASTATIAPIFVPAKSNLPELLEFWYSTDGGFVQASYATGTGQLSFAKRAWKVENALGALTSIPQVDPTRSDRGRILHWFSPDGSVMHTNLQETGSDYGSGYAFNSFQIIKPGDKLSPGPGAGIAGLIKPGTSRIEVFWIGDQGAINNHSWDPITTLNPYAVTAAGTAWEKSYVAALGLDANEETVWCIGPQGQIRGFWSTNITGWKSAVTDAAVGNERAALESCIALVSPSAGALSVFWVSPAGVIQGLYCPGQNSNWKLLTLSGIPPARVDSEVKAVSYNTNQIALFWVGPDDYLQSAVGTLNGNDFTWTYQDVTGAGAVAGGSPLCVQARSGHVLVTFKDYNNEVNCIVKDL